MSSAAGNKVLLAWRNEFNLGIDSVDEQHQRLLDLINGLWDATVRGLPAAQLLSHVAELERYTVYHFTDEEGAMRAAGYPRLDAHCKAHQGFVQRISDEKKRVLTEGNITLDLVRFLQEWLLNHIAVQDKHYASYVLESQQRISFFSRLLRRFA